jgi:uncharacterized CHY-type Zn-finger protein
MRYLEKDEQVAADDKWDRLARSKGWVCGICRETLSREEVGEVYCAYCQSKLAKLAKA